MVRRRRKIKPEEEAVNVKLNIGSLSFLGILIISAIVALFNIDPTYGYVPTLIMAILGAIIAIDNITKKEEVRFMLAITTFGVVVIALMSYLILPEAIGIFLANIIVALGISGLIVATGTILKLGWTK